MPRTIFRLSLYDQAETAASFETLKKSLCEMLPANVDIQHVGATSIPGCLTKADIDLCVRVTRECFAFCDEALARHFSRNTGSVGNEYFSAFQTEKGGIQLVVIDSPLDIFTLFRDLLCNDPSLLNEYNLIKQRHDGKPMAQYRKAKDSFIEYALSR